MPSNAMATRLTKFTQAVQRKSLTGRETRSKWSGELDEKGYNVPKLRARQLAGVPMRQPVTFPAPILAAMLSLPPLWLWRLV
jgi:hypothetical protein